MIRKAAFLGLTFALYSTLALRAESPFQLDWMQSSYWTDGKAEFNTYSGTISRYGQVRNVNSVTHIIVRENFAPEALVKADNWQQEGAYPVLKLNQILDIPTGIYVYQQMHSNFWKVADGQLLKASLTSNDSCGNSFKNLERAGENMIYSWDTYWQGMVAGNTTLNTPDDAVFYDELPVRVRMIDFENGPDSFTIPLAKSIINSKQDDIQFDAAWVNIYTEDSTNSIEVIVTHAAGKDTFTLANEFPHLLMEWRRADGGTFTLERSLKIDYWNYNDPQANTRALTNPDLQLYP